jgi:hypothetical protein
LLAVQAIAAEIHAADAPRSAAEAWNEPTLRRQCRQASALMTRQALQWRKQLRLVRETRFEAIDDHEQAEAERSQSTEQPDSSIYMG